GRADGSRRAGARALPGVGTSGPTWCGDCTEECAGLARKGVDVGDQRERAQRDEDGARGLEMFARFDRPSERDEAAAGAHQRMSPLEREGERLPTSRGVYVEIYGFRVIAVR